ncbi:type III-B CRISPR module-associated Cmr3 family protein [Microbispora rosea]|uniref:type III-B CRISPR module-associated Cmr3 family protein n=1 Tax=Microbispora rosea TaxID=58117 RepID=UPI003693A505
MREVVLTAQQGLAMGGPAEVGYDKQTLPYVPGSSLRGALAAVWIREYGVPSRDNPRRAEFIDLFEGEVCYGSLLQDGTAVTPLSAIRCKYPRTGVCHAWSADAAVDGEATTCPECGGGVEFGKGDLADVATRRVLRTELDADGRPRQSHLYARHELLRGLTYRGRITGTHPWLDSERDVWLGGRTTTSGRATFRAVPVAAPPGVPRSPRSDGAIVIRFAAPAIIVDGAGRPTLNPVPEIVRVLGLPERCLVSSRTWTRPQRVGGWHAASGLPKPTELAMSMGSVTVLHLAEEPDAERLGSLAVSGIGLRRVEGFGVAEINPEPWRLAEVNGNPKAVEAEPSPLEQLDELGLLKRELQVRWLLDRGRRVAVERERGRGGVVDEFFKEPVAVYFDDRQADAVRRLFTSERLPGAIVLLEQRLEDFRAAGGTP